MRVKKLPLATSAYEEIKNRIVKGVLPQGYPILEKQLAVELGISRTPLREALARLQHDGLVLYIPRKGFFVSRVSLEDMQEIWDMLEGLEGMATKLAAERATEEDIRRMEEATRKQEDALQRDDIESWILHDEAFHNAILGAARNRRIKEAASQVKDQWRRQLSLTMRLRPKPVESTKVHRATLEAIKARDGELARRIYQSHRSETNKIVMGILRSIDSTPGE